MDDGYSDGMDLARQRAAQQQQAQEFAFRQQQADINNSQQDRASPSSSSTRIRCGGCGRWSTPTARRKSPVGSCRTSTTARFSRPRAARHDARIAGGVGPVQPHPLQTIPDDVILGASPSGRAAYLSSMQRNAGFQQRRQAGSGESKWPARDGTPST